MALTIEQKKQLAQSNHLSWLFRFMISEERRKRQNAARKSIKENDAENVVHDPSIALVNEANDFVSFEKQYAKQLQEANSEAKLLLINIIGDFDFSSVTTETAITDEVINEMALQTYSPSQGVELNVFELIINQTFEGYKQQVKTS